MTTDPRHIKEIIDEVLRSHPLFKGYFPNTELSIDLKLLTRNPGRMGIGVGIPGTIVRDGEYHYTFIEAETEAESLKTDVKTYATDAHKVHAQAEASDAPQASEKRATPVKRNPIVIPGKCVNLHCNDDGTLYLAFRRPALSEDYTFRNFLLEAAQEILALASLGDDELLKART